MEEKVRALALHLRQAKAAADRVAGDPGNTKAQRESDFHLLEALTIAVEVIGSVAVSMDRIATALEKGRLR